jgi:hypothetical protein
MRRESVLLIRLINIIFGIIESLIGLRVLLKLLGANPSAAFVQWVYQTSIILLDPFKGMFPSPMLKGRFILEFSALFALIIYGLIGYFLVKLVMLVETAIKRKNK